MKSPGSRETTTPKGLKTIGFSKIQHARGRRCWKFCNRKVMCFIGFLNIAFRKPLKTLSVCNDFDTRTQRPRGCPLCGIFCNELLTWTHVEKQNLNFILVFTIYRPSLHAGLKSGPGTILCKKQGFLKFSYRMIRIWYYLTRMDPGRDRDRADCQVKNKVLWSHDQDMVLFDKDGPGTFSRPGRLSGKTQGFMIAC